MTCNICHLLGSDANRRLLRRLHHAIQPSGHLAIADIVATEGPDVPEQVARYELSKAVVVRTR